MICYSRYLIDLCVPWLEESSPLFKRSMSGVCSLINEWNKKSATFIERQCFCVLSNFIMKGYQSSHNNETAASAWQQQNADWWSEMKKQITTLIIQKILPSIDVERWIQMMKLLED